MSGIPWDAFIVSVPSDRKGSAVDYHIAAVPLDDWSGVGNFGIVLDGKFLGVDFDRKDPVREAWVERMPSTWHQGTPHGEHFLFRVPPGFVGKNVEITGSDGKPIGHVKPHGYIVGPGSRFKKCPNHPKGCDRARESYDIIDDRDPVMAPEWMLDVVRNSFSTHEAAVAQGEERDIIADGGRDDFFAALGGYLRRQQLSESAIKAAMAAVLTSGVVEQPEGREMEGRDIERIARSVSKYPIGPELGVRLIQPTIMLGSETQLIGPPVAWWLRGFIPQNELCMMYGKGGVGKSTIASWGASIVTRKKKRFLFIGVEEPWQRFLLRAVLMGADPAYMAGLSSASSVLIPGGLKGLKEVVEGYQADFIYFDSIYTHFQHFDGLNAAERARKCLGPLAEWAQSDLVTIMGVFHENKIGAFLGSTEMENVARHVLHVKRKKGQKTRLAVDKTNLWDPGFEIEFDSTRVPMVDPFTGEAQEEILDDGSRVVMEATIIEKGREIATYEALEDEEADEIEEGLKGKTIDDIGAHE